MKRSLSFIVPIAALAGPLFFLAACSEAPPVHKPAPVSRAVTIATVEQRALARTVTASGLLVAREEAAVGVERAGVRVLRVLVEEGTLVKAGQPLALLDDARLREQVAQARAQAERARSEAERVDGLDGTGVVSEEDISNRRSQARIAEAQLRDLEVQSRQTTVRAPVSGMVIERSVRPGSLSGGESMFRLVRDNRVELDAEVPEATLLGITTGRQVKVTLANGQAFEGVVRLVSPRIDPQTKLGRVRVALPVDPVLRVGGFARASFVDRPAPVTVVPEKAVQFEASGPLVTVIGADNRARRVAVKTGQRAEGLVELVDGPPVGARVALAGGAFLLDGDLVQPESAPGAASGAGR